MVCILRLVFFYFFGYFWVDDDKDEEQSEVSISESLPSLDESAGKL